MQTKEETTKPDLTQRAGRGKKVVKAITEDIRNGTWKIIVSALLGSVVTIVGWSYVTGRNDASVEARLSRLEEQFSEANVSLKEIAATLQKQNTQYLGLQNQLDQLNSKAAARWTSQDQKIFALQLQLDNQTLKVPSIDQIIQNRSLP